MHFVIKNHFPDTAVPLFELRAAKTMYGGKQIKAGDTAFLFASENEGGSGLVVRGIVTCAANLPKVVGVDRQTPRVSVTVRPTSLAIRPLGRSQLKRFTDWNDGRPETELNFKLYRQGTDKVVGISNEAASFLDSFF